ncbi:hypothetical protein GCG21_15275 [Pseudactinotalea sp. HY160]|uniref:LssY C-terminal domain-containing protein n=1 Tax=Pseudactinotalea sp. HY160 TaxID=2654490 RepID=UPI00128C0DEE|nr:LssY C-terminal domain-containing protein [Pseudactinotalea sp. HY160]MPV51345.1 hypothetical protein [Pseudactinotalea sp. HY160]
MVSTFSRRAHAAVEVARADPMRFVDRVFFVYGTAAATWLAFLLIHQLLTSGWRHIWAFIPFWLIVTYLLLPRVHSVLSRIYLPDYFIGRSRTREGLLGDPVNLVLLGSEDHVHTAMLRAGWHRADELNLTSGWRLVAATLRRTTYPDAPVSSLFLFGRRQAFTYQQEEQGNPAQRHHVRFWPAPEGWLLPGGRRVDWLAAGTYDRAVGLSLFTGQVTHRIAADIDVERDHIVATLTRPESGNERIGVEVLASFSSGYHHRNGGGDRIRTDGDLPIVDLRPLPPASAAVREQIEADRAEAGQRRRVPLTLAFGVLVMLLRVVAGVVSVNWLIGLGSATLATLPIVRPVADLLGLSDAATYATVIVIVGTFLATYLVLAGFVYAGYGWARTSVLGLSVASTSLWTVMWFIEVSERTLALNLVGTAAEIMVVLVLSGDIARLYVARRRVARQQLRATRPTRFLARR